MNRLHLFIYLLLVFNEADFVGARFCLTYDVDDNGVYFSPRRVDQIRGSVILEQSANVIQSNKDFEAFGEIYKSIIDITAPEK